MIDHSLYPTPHILPSSALDQVREQELDVTHDTLSLISSPAQPFYFPQVYDPPPLSHHQHPSNHLYLAIRYRPIQTSAPSPPSDSALPSSVCPPAGDVDERAHGSRRFFSSLPPPFQSLAAPMRCFAPRPSRAATREPASFPCCPLYGPSCSMQSPRRNQGREACCPAVAPYPGTPHTIPHPLRVLPVTSSIQWLRRRCYRPEDSLTGGGRASCGTEISGPVRLHPVLPLPAACGDDFTGSVVVFVVPPSLTTPTERGGHLICVVLVSPRSETERGCVHVVGVPPCNVARTPGRYPPPFVNGGATSSQIPTIASHNRVANPRLGLGGAPPFGTGRGARERRLAGVGPAGVTSGRAPNKRALAARTER